MNTQMQPVTTASEKPRAHGTRGPAGQRMAAVWVPNWPLLVAMLAHNLDATQPAVLQRGRRVHVVSAAARAFGVRRHMALRAAQELCPQLHILDEDPDLAAREFEYIAQVVETIVPTVEIIRPGLLLFAARGATKYYGTEDAVCAAVIEVLAEQAQCEAQVGVANGILGAILAARTMRVVGQDQTQEFLGPRPLTDLTYAAVTSQQQVALGQFLSLQQRLGIKTFGALAALPHAHVHTRFGDIGAWAHRLASGLDIREQSPARQEPDITVSSALDPPVDRIDTAAFAARSLAQELHRILLAGSVTCSRIEIMATTSAGEELTRTWRTDDSALGAMSAARITQRVRWQLEGWLTASSIAQQRRRKAALAVSENRAVPGSVCGASESQEILEHPEPVTLTKLQLTAQFVVPTQTHQESLWGRSDGANRRAQSAIERVQDLLGPQAVLALAPAGGHTYQDRITSGWWANQEAPARDGKQTWPGQLPSPAPATLFQDPWDIAVVDERNLLVTFNNRLGMSASPYAVIQTDPRWGVAKVAQPVRNWAGPWPIRTRWWTEQAQHCIYLQLVLDHQPALLAVYRQGSWYCEGIYD